METFVSGVGLVLFGLAVSAAWKTRFGKPYLFGFAALVGTLGMGWCLGVKEASDWLFLTSITMVLVGCAALSEWVGAEIRYLEGQRRAAEKGGSGEPKNDSAE